MEITQSSTQIQFAQDILSNTWYTWIRNFLKHLLFLFLLWKFMTIQGNKWL